MPWGLSAGGWLGEGAFSADNRSQPPAWVLTLRVGYPALTGILLKYGLGEGLRAWKDGVAEGGPHRHSFFTPQKEQQPPTSSNLGQGTGNPGTWARGMKPSLQPWALSCLAQDGADRLENGP